MMKAELRVKSVGTKVTEAEYAQLEAAAKASGQTLAEWARKVLLASIEQPSATPAEETLLAGGADLLRSANKGNESE